MAKKDQLEKDYKNLNRNIEQAAEAEIKKIQEKIEALKEEARQMGETAELKLVEKETKVTTKKD
jgi:outer membrane murein-binding lipoprotein Lpp